MNTTKLKSQIAKLQEKLKIAEAKESEKSKTKTLIIDGVEYETETSQLGKSFDDIVIPNGWRLWTAKECIKLFNNHKEELNLADCWFFIEQPFKLNKDNNLVARFYAYSDRAYLICGGYPTGSYSALGVRFARKKISKGKKL